MLAKTYLLRSAILSIGIFCQFTGNQLAAQPYYITPAGLSQSSFSPHTTNFHALQVNHLWYDVFERGYSWHDHHLISLDRISVDRIKPLVKESQALESLSNNNTWVNIGPQGGSVRTITTFGRDPSVIFLGTGGGGLYKSVDAGENWQLISTNERVLIGPGASIADIKFSQNKLYVCSTTGLLVSNDLGESWEPSLITLTGNLTAIVINPATPEVLYVSHYTAGVFPDFIGVLKSMDGGKNWFIVKEGFASTDVTDLKISVSNPEVLYAATLKGVFMTDDGGVSGWRNISGNLANTSIHAIVVDEAHGNVMYAGTASGVFKTTNGGNTWTNITGENFENRFVSLNGIGIIDSIIWVGTRNGLYKSTNGGLTWQKKTQDLGNSAIGGSEIVNQDYIKLGTADGFYQSLNGGEIWKKYNRGLSAFVIEALAFDPSITPARIFAGTSGAGVYTSDDAGEHWQDLAMDTGATSITALVLQPDSPQIMYAGLIKQSDTENSTIETGVYKSVDAGISWQRTSAGLEDAFIINAITLNPISNHVLYAATSNGLYKSINGALSWELKSSGIEVENTSCLVIDPQNPNIIYAGTSFGPTTSNIGVYKSIDAGEHWEYSSNGLPFANEGRRDIEDMCINPMNPQIIYAGVLSEGVYKTTNGGNSWRKVLDTKNVDFIFSLTIDPQDTNRLYTAGAIKIYKSDNAGQSWQEMMEGLPEYFGQVNTIRVDPADPRRIYAATYGYGVLSYFRTGTSSVEDTDEPLPNTLVLYQNYPNPFNPITTIAYQIPQAGKVTIAIYNVQGQLVRTLIEEHENPGKFSRHWDGLDEAGNRVTSGIYLYRMVSGNFVDMKKMVLIQ